MKKSTAIIAVLCAAFMSATALAACGEPSTPSGDTTATVAAADNSGSEQSQETTEAEAEKKIVDTETLAAADIPSGTPTDFGWISFEMPDGYSKDDAVDEDYWIRLKCDDDAFVQIDIKYSSFDYDGDIQGPVDARLKYYGNQGTDFEMGGITYRPMFYTEGGSMDGTVCFTPINDKVYFEMQGLDVGLKDPAFCTILNTVKFDESKIDK